MTLQGVVAEAEDGALILGTGMALMAVQHVAAHGWVPTGDLGRLFGRLYGANAARYTAEAGIPGGVNLWLGLEDIPGGTAHEDIVAYANAWYDEVAAAGFRPGVYIGFNVWLSPQSLFFDLKFRHYWRAPGNIPDVAIAATRRCSSTYSIPAGETLWTRMSAVPTAWETGYTC